MSRTGGQPSPDRPGPAARRGVLLREGHRDRAGRPPYGLLFDHSAEDRFTTGGFLAKCGRHSLAVFLQQQAGQIEHGLGVQVAIANAQVNLTHQAVEVISHGDRHPPNADLPTWVTGAGVSPCGGSGRVHDLHRWRALWAVTCRWTHRTVRPRWKDLADIGDEPFRRVMTCGKD